MVSFKSKVMKKIKCPWCGRMVGFSKSGNLEPHIQSTNVKCVGVGQLKLTVTALIKSKERHYND